MNIQGHNRTHRTQTRTKRQRVPYCGSNIRGVLLHNFFDDLLHRDDLRWGTAAKDEKSNDGDYRQTKEDGKSDGPRRDTTVLATKVRLPRQTPVIAWV